MSAELLLRDSPEESQYSVLYTDDIPESVTHQKGVSKYTRRLREELAGRGALITWPFLDPTGGTITKLIDGYSFREEIARKTDLIHVTAPRVYYLPLLSADVTTVLTVHGLDYYIPEGFKQPPWNLRAYLYQKLIPRVANQADVYIVSTEFMASQLRLAGVDNDDIFITPFGVDDLFREQYASLTRYGDYVLTDTPEPEVIEAFARVASGTDYDLVVFSKRGYGYLEGRLAAEEWGVTDQCRWLGYVEGDERLARLYQSADAFVHWSGHETWGFPPLEAMATGTPTVCNDAGSLPEVVGNGGLIVNDVNGAASALADILWSEDHREELGHRGREWTDRFQWSTTAERTLGVYETVMERFGR